MVEETDGGTIQGNEIVRLGEKMRIQWNGIWKYSGAH